MFALQFVMLYEPPFNTGCNSIVKTRMGVVDRRNVDKAYPSGETLNLAACPIDIIAIEGSSPL